MGEDVDLGALADSMSAQAAGIVEAWARVDPVDDDEPDD